MYSNWKITINKIVHIEGLKIAFNGYSGLPNYICTRCNATMRVSSLQASLHAGANLLLRTFPGLYSIAVVQCFAKDRYHFDNKKQNFRKEAKERKNGGRL